MQNPYAPPAAPQPAAPPPGYYPPQNGPGFLVQGDTVTISPLVWWPPVCVKCGTTSDLKSRVQKYAWVPPWAYFFLFLGALPGVIILSAMTKRTQMTHPICTACDKEWSKATLMWRLALLGPVFLGFGGFLVGAAVDSGALMAVGGLLFFPGLLVFPLLVHFTRVTKRTLQPKLIDAQVIKLQGVAPAAIQALVAMMQPR